MKKIRSKNTAPELQFRRKFWQLGYRYRINPNTIPGKPDLFIGKYNLAIFIDGEFWHGYNWEVKKQKLKSNRDYWIPKIEKNISRDIQNNRKLSEMGIRVFRFWERDIKNNLAGCIHEVIEYINEVKTGKS